MTTPTAALAALEFPELTEATRIVLKDAMNASEKNHLSREDRRFLATSCNNIKGDAWFRNIPKGTMVALQGRDNDPGSATQFNEIDSFVECYPLDKILFSGEVRLRDPETAYRRFMIIGNR
jgi:hypothetical protein